MDNPETRAKSCLNRILELWQVDSSWMKWLEAKAGSSAGFEWWPGDYQVRVQATTSRESNTNGTIKLTVRTSFLHQIDPNSEKFETFVGKFARFTTSTYGWVYPPRRVLDHFRSPTNFAELWLHGSVYINNQNAGWLTDFFANTSIIQPINAQIQGSQMPSIAGSGVANMARPAAMEGWPLDNILEVVAEVYAPIGREVSRFGGHDEFKEFAETYARNDNCFGNGDATGLTLETPFGSDSALIRLKTDEAHPQLGSGLLVTLQLPYSGDALSMSRKAAKLNFLETIEWTEFPQLGSWHTAQNRGSDEGLAFTLFVPSALYKPMLATNIAFWFIYRDQWARKTLYPEMEDLTMAQILQLRKY